MLSPDLLGVLEILSKDKTGAGLNGAKAHLLPTQTLSGKIIR